MARHLLVLNLALTVGMLVTGVVADGFARIGVGVIGVVRFAALILLVPLILLIFEVHPRGYWVWASFGFLSNLAIVVYPAISAHFTVRYAGRAMTGLNLLLFLGAFLIQYLVGASIDLWPPGPGGGITRTAIGPRSGSSLSSSCSPSVAGRGAGPAPEHLGSGSRSVAHPATVASLLSRASSPGGIVII